MNDDNTIIAKTTDDRPSVYLFGRDPNANLIVRGYRVSRHTNRQASAVLGACSMAARTAGWSDGRWNKFHDEATSGGLNHLLCTVNKHFDIE